MKLLSLLEELGIPRNEAITYTQLLKTPQTSAYELARSLGMDRTLTYQVLNKLIEKGLVTFVIKENKKVFSAASAENLLHPIKKQELLAQEAIKQAEKIDTTPQQEYAVTVYEGKKAIRNIFKQALKEQEFLSFGATGRGAQGLYETPHLLAQAQQQEMDIRIIFGEAHKTRKEVEQYKQAIKARFTTIDANATTSIWGEHIAIHLLTAKPFIIVIQNKEIARSYKNYFEALWELAEE